MILNKYMVTVERTGTICKRLNNRLHCTTGPAIEYLNGRKSWYYKEVYLSKCEFDRMINNDK